MTDTLIRAVDVSSFQSPSRTSLDQWIGTGAQLVLIHAYSSVEQAGLSDTTRQWVQIAREAACWRLPYVFLYAFSDPAEEVRSALDLWRDCGETSGLVALDCEQYQGDAGPTVEEILAAVAECHRQGVNAIGYSRANWIERLPGAERLAVIPWWLADYNDQPTLDVVKPAWMELVGHQYTSDPVDWSVFSLERLSELAKGYVKPDPWLAIKDAITTELANIDAARARIAELLAG